MWTSPIGLFDHRFDHCKTSLGFHSTGTVKPGTHPKPPKTKSWNLKNRRYFVQGISFFSRVGVKKLSGLSRQLSPTESTQLLAAGVLPLLRQLRVPPLVLSWNRWRYLGFFLEVIEGDHQMLFFGGLWSDVVFFKWKKQDVMVGKGLKFWCLLACFDLKSKRE